MLPDMHPPHTPLLDLQPMPVTALHNRQAQAMYRFTHFNPIQTQVFHTCYHTDHNVLLGAPTGSGKTIVAELAILRLFREQPSAKVVYVAPMKALARERLEDWRSARSFAGAMGKTVVELTGDTTPDARLLKDAHIIITTPEKWDGISRSWQQRGYVKAVGLIIIDEIHLLGQERGPVLEVIVSRARYISSHTLNPVRIVGLSTALANARDLADWLGIENVGAGLFNFEPIVRPVPITIHISGFEGKHYCPRMATMNKPTYAAIMTYSPQHPALVFVSSRRQTRLTALDLVSFSAADGNPRKFLRNVSDQELQLIVAAVKGQLSSAQLSIRRLSLVSRAACTCACACACACASCRHELEARASVRYWPAPRRFGGA
jgi:activating signal cointegrator complex subunit 3